MQMKIKMITKILLGISLILILCCNGVKAADTAIQLINSNEVVDGYKIMFVKINYEQEVGVIEGYIKGNDNISTIEVVQTYNGWTTSFNPENGKFNTFNAAGGKTGNIVQIKYKVKDETKDAKISLSKIELTTLDYKTIKVNEDVEKNVENKKEEENKNEESNKKEEENKSNSSNNSEKPNTSSSNIKKENTSNIATTPKKLPKAGIKLYSIMGISALAIFIVITFIIYKKFYKDVK